MRTLLTRLFAPPSSRRSRRDSPRGFAAEVLEDRILMTTYDGQRTHGIAGRTDAGGWYASSFDVGVAGLATQKFAQWNAAVNWQDVRFGDFDGDRLHDVVGRDPATGNWWVSLSDGTGSTTKLAGHWSTGTTWSDVMVVDLASPGDRPSEGTYPGRKADLIGRAANGTWWAAVSTGLGTFTNVALTNWSPDAGWRDVGVTDINLDGASDIVGRDGGGNWWAAISQVDPVTKEGLTYQNQLLASWNEAAGWQDVSVGKVSNGIYSTLTGRTANGDWWMTEFNLDGVATTKFLGTWNEAAGWQDVMVADLNNSPDSRGKIIGRTASGDWWSSEIIGGVFTSKFIGHWNEAAGWQDVQVAGSNFTGSEILIGRTAGGAWWSSAMTPAGTLAHTSLGVWNEAAGWNDVSAANISRERIVVITDYTGSVEVRIFAHRAGVDVTVANFNNVQMSGIAISYVVTGSAIVTQKTIAYSNLQQPDRWLLRFGGNYGNDSFNNLSNKDSRALGMLGHDTLKGLGNGAFDWFFGGPGINVLLGDPTDQLST